MIHFFIIFALTLFSPSLSAQAAEGRTDWIRVQPLPRHQAPLVSIGVLVLNVTEQAEVYIDDRLVGEAPFRDRFIPLAPGSYTVDVKKEGYKPWAQAIDIPEDGEIHLSVSLKRRTGLLIVRPNVAGTEVFIDGVRKETARLLEGIKFTPGEHTVRVTKKGFLPWERPVVVQEDKKIAVNPSLKERLGTPRFRASPRERPQKRSRKEEEEIMIFPAF